MAKQARQFAGVRLDPAQKKWLAVGARILGSESAVIRAVIDEAMARGLTFGAVVPESIRRTGGA